MFSGHGRKLSDEPSFPKNTQSKAWFEESSSNSVNGELPVKTQMSGGRVAFSILLFSTWTGEYLTDNVVLLLGVPQRDSVIVV